MTMLGSPARCSAAILGLALAAGLAVATEEDGIKAVTAAGGKLAYEKVGKKKSVSGVKLTGAKVTDAVAKSLLEFPELTRVEIKAAPKLTADGVAELASVKKLQ